MKKLALLLNWPCLAFCLLGLLLSALRTNQPSGITLLVPFAVTLATLYFRPGVWFVGIALAANAFMLVAVGFFVLFSLAQNHYVPSGPFFLWVVFIAMLVVPSINLFALSPYLSAKYAG